MNRTKLSGVAILLCAASATQGALTINPTWGAGFNGADAASLSRKAVAEAAVGAWETRLAIAQVNYTVGITFRFEDLTGFGANLRGAAYGNTQMVANNLVTGTKLPTAGIVGINNQYNDWFWDPTPADNSEFTMNAPNWFGTAPVGSAARNKFDAYATILHEMGHVLGFMGTTGTWANMQPFTAYTDFANNLDGAFTTFTFDKINLGYEGGIMSPTWPTVAMSGPFHTNSNDRLMGDPGFGTSQRSLISGLDVDVICDAFNLCVPAPGTGGLVIALVTLGARRRRR